MMYNRGIFIKMPEIQRIIYYFINLKIREKVAILATFFSGGKTCYNFLLDLF